MSLASGAAPLPRVRWTGAAARFAAVCAVVLVLAAVHLRNRPPTLCLLRATTGLPCPFCGGTTAAVDLGHGRIAAAVGASPLAVLGLATWPFLGAVRPPQWWADRRWRRLAIAVVLLASEAWQIHRFGVLGA